MRFPLIIEGSVKNLKVSHNSKTKFTKVQLGKYTATSKGKKLNAEGLWPISLVIGDLKLKIIAKYSKKHKKYEIEVNGQDYFQLPYEAPNFTSIDDDEETIELIKGKITCNGKVAMNTDTNN